jgi:hypothetical protein
VERRTLTQKDEKMLDVLERKILRRIYGPTRDRDQWKWKLNRELYDVFGESRRLMEIRTARMLWAAHVARMDEICMSRRLPYLQPEGLRKAGKQRAR